jgi:aryl-alcohol dehydrogenase-like predicted oxidoreductase
MIWVINKLEQLTGFGLPYNTTGEEEPFKALTYAADHGLTFWDTADIYGGSSCFVHPVFAVYCTDSHWIGEASLGEWFTQTGRRSEIFLATKFGAHDFSELERKRQLNGAPPSTEDSLPALQSDFADVFNTSPNSKPSYIARQFKYSLSALKTDYIDLYYQHRVDPDVPIEVVLETLRPYVESGQIRWLGLSECSAATLKRAKAVKGIGEKVVVVQMEFSPFELEIEKSGFVDVVNEAGIAIVAYSPLSRGLVTGKYVLHRFWFIQTPLISYYFFLMILVDIVLPLILTQMTFGGTFPGSQRRTSRRISR